MSDDLFRADFFLPHPVRHSLSLSSHPRSDGVHIHTSSNTRQHSIQFFGEYRKGEHYHRREPDQASQTFQIVELQNGPGFIEVFFFPFTFLLVVIVPILVVRKRRTPFRIGRFHSIFQPVPRALEPSIEKQVKRDPQDGNEEGEDKCRGDGGASMRRSGIEGHEFCFDGPVV
jgi:hypothetical protein